MNTLVVGIAVLPGTVALLLVLVSTYLYRQSADRFFRIWQISYSLSVISYALVAANHLVPPTFLGLWLGRFAAALAAIAILASTRQLRRETLVERKYMALAAIALVWSGFSARALANLSGPVTGRHALLVDIEAGIALTFFYCGWRYWRQAKARDSAGVRMLAGSTIAWGVLLVLQHFETSSWAIGELNSLFTTLPHVVIGLGLVMAMFDSERRSMQENLLAFSTLNVDTSRLLTAEEVAPALQRVVDRLMELLDVDRAALLIGDRWRAIVPAVQVGFTKDFLDLTQYSGIAQFLSDAAYRRGGVAAFTNLQEGTGSMTERDLRFAVTRQVLLNESVQAVTAVSVQTREFSLGVLLFPMPPGKVFGSGQVRLLLGLAMQIGMTLENYVLMHEAQRRTKEYELLTEIGQVISSRLDSDEVLRAVHRELGQLFDTENFYIALQDDGQVCFELQVLDGIHQAKRTRAASNGVTDYILRTSEPLLIRNDMAKARQRLGLDEHDRIPRCFCGVPIFIGGRAAGVMAAMNFEREFAYDDRDIEVMKTAAGQVAVAMENARLFAEQQRRSRHLAFLNAISKTAISSQDAEQMLDEIAHEISRNFEYDHIGIGIVDYATKDIEIKAEAGTTAEAKGRRLPLGAGVIGRVARGSEMALVQGGDEQLGGVTAGARSVLCIPITYGETLLGVLNIESRRENAFAQQEVMILRTLADLLATALHNAFVFQKLQQQSITDGLTGIKTRRFFLEGLQGEYKRAARSGRPFSVVLIDLDKFKEVNDGMGHLEGDLVLARIGRLLEQKCRQSNVVARYGGDEFVILMPETSVEQAQVLSERLRLWIATDPMLNERHITGSFGVATYPLHGSTAEDILRVADAGMYVSKHAGGNRVSTAEEFSESEGTVLQRQMISTYIEGFLQREHTGPDSAEELIARLKKLGANSQDQHTREAMMEAVAALTRAVETREIHGSGHGDAVARYAETMGRLLGMNDADLAELSYVARVHDVGKIVIPERILNKASSLTADEFRVVKQHPKVGAQIVETIPGGARLAHIVRHHHEWVNGKGYPDGLRGDEIPLAARIIAVAEAFANMILERPYAEQRDRGGAITELQQLSGKQFDGRIVEALVETVRTERTAAAQA